MNEDQVAGVLNTVPPVVDHGHNVAKVQAFHHDLHEVFVTPSSRHKLLQGELACVKTRVKVQTPTAFVKLIQRHLTALKQTVSYKSNKLEY